MTRQHDVVIYGASGYTGRLVAEYFVNRYGSDTSFSLALAARNVNKMEEVRDEVGLPKDTPILEANADDAASLDTLAKSAQVIITTVGPYQLYGEGLVKACAENGTHYVDLCGETLFMHDMIARYQDKAKETGARIVFSCGFDSIPFDLGVFFLQENAKDKLGKTFDRVRGRVRGMQGSFSGGTAASLKESMARLKREPEVFSIMVNPYSLCEGNDGVAQPDGSKPLHDDVAGSWVAPFVMAAINVPNILRSNHLMGYPYGQNFQYDEMMLTGPGDQGEEMAKAVASTDMIGSTDLKPGEGPSKEERENGSYDVLFIGGDGELKASVKGDKDPGYASTSRMIAESALCLIKDVPDLAGGIYTPAPAMGHKLIKRLEDNAEIYFQVEN